LKITENINSYAQDKKSRLKFEQKIKKAIKKIRKEESRRNSKKLQKQHSQEDVQLYMIP